MGSEAQLAAQIWSTVYEADKFSKLGQTDLALVCDQSSSVHAGLQVSMCNGYHLCYTG